MSATMQKSQRILMLVLPIVFIPFILNFPSGLMVYWLTTNLWTTGQGIVTRQLMPKPDPDALKRSLADAAEGPAAAGRERQARRASRSRCRPRRPLPARRDA